jgi:hypothetical protein
MSYKSTEEYSWIFKFDCYSFLTAYSHQAHSTHNARAMLPAETFETRESLLSLSLEKPRYNGKAILKNYEPFIYGDIRY